MITKLTLENFKNFRQAELELGPFTVLIGANATGKSNIREAFRFLHGIGRGYSVPEIIGEKWIEGGVRVWSGIRGGVKEIIYQNAVSPESFSPDSLVYCSVGVESHWQDNSNTPSSITYMIQLAQNGSKNNIFISKEQLLNIEKKLFAYEYNPTEFATMELAGFSWPNLEQDKPIHPLLSSVENGGKLHAFLTEPLSIDDKGNPKWLDETGEVQKQIKNTLRQFKPMRFFDFVPDTMRRPSFPGQVILGDSGENLSSVLYAIYQDEQKRASLIEWLRELTPMDAVDFEFPPDQVGRVLVTLVEKNGRKISAYSASDGTLRFLGILAALLGPNLAGFYFFEELENGIHPSRLHLLIELIEQVTAEGNIQIVTTTHSPQLLSLLSDQTLQHAALTYRLENQPDAHIKPLLDIPGVMDVIQEEDLSRLHERGWLENSVHFMQQASQPA